MKLSRTIGCWFLLVLVLCVIGFALFLYFGPLGGSLLRHKTTESFLFYASRVNGTTRLQVTTLRAIEIFQLSDAPTVLGIPLPEVVVEARAPVETTWYLDLKSPWTVRVADVSVLVNAPALQFNTPAIDVAHLDYREVKGSLWRRSAPVAEKLRLALGPMARRAAASHLPEVRETARAQVAAFVRAWILHEKGDGKTGPVVVRFADEPEPAPTLAPPSRG